MYYVILFILSGIGFGYLIRGRNTSFVSSLLMISIYLLLLFLGIEVGENPRIVSSLNTLGMKALTISLGGTLGSCLLAKALWEWSKKGYNSKTVSPQGTSADLPLWQAMKGSLIIIAFFAVGCFIGLTNLLPFSIENTPLSFIVLAVLLVAVGMNIGSNPTLVQQFRNLPMKFLLLPVVTILGTLIGCSIIYVLFCPYAWSKCMAVGCGFGYYSLSSILINDAVGAELGTVALLANIIRELITLLTSPFLVKYFGKLAPISAGGATSMDTTLPVITHTCGNEFVIVSLYAGFMTDFSVPFLVTFFCNF